jgi:superfamily II DNA or RNA helicase
METLYVRKQNEVYLEVFTESGIELELSEYFSFFVPGYKFMPQYKSRMWDGKIRLYNRYKKTLYIGLLYRLIQFCKERNYEYQLEDGVLAAFKGDPIEQFDKFEKTLKLPFTLREYQKEAIQYASKRKRTLLLSPTSSGKSAIIYSLIRKINKKTLLIVPTVSLVSQMQSDFESYSKNDPSFDAEDDVHCIYQGQSKTTDKQVVISTWQSIYKMPLKYFSQYEVVIGDECHQYKAKSLTGILEKTINAEYKIGTTGTLDGTLTHKLVLEGLFGKVYQVTTTNKLMQDKHVADLKINCVILQYEEAIRKSCKKMKYQEEIKFLVGCEERNNFICKLSCKMKGNTLVLFQYVDKHGKVLHKMIEDRVRAKSQTRKVFFVAGETDKDTREEVRKITEGEKDAIIIASVGVFSTGVNIQNLENIIFTAPSKSKIRTLQSIGRGLRIGRTGKAILYDICDDLSIGAHKNFSYKHFLERVKFYIAEKFEYKIFNIDL